MLEDLLSRGTRSLNGALCIPTRGILPFCHQLQGSHCLTASHVAAATIRLLHDRPTKHSSRTPILHRLERNYTLCSQHGPTKADSHLPPDADDAAEDRRCGSDRIGCLDYWITAHLGCCVFQRPNQSLLRDRLESELIRLGEEVRLAYMRPCGFLPDRIQVIGHGPFVSRTVLPKVPGVTLEAWGSRSRCKSHPALGSCI
jgi:hypothetical protein